MNRYVKGALAVGALALALCAIYYFYAPELPANKSPAEFSLLDRMEKEGVPSFSAERVGGGEFSLEKFRGKIVIVNFWASWCNPCVQEFASLGKLASAFPDDLRLVAVSNDENRNEAISFIGTLKLRDTVAVLWDPQRQIAKQFGVEKIPESFIVGRDTKLIRKVVGVDNWYNDNTLAYFRELIAQPAK